MINVVNTLKKVLLATFVIGMSASLNAQSPLCPLNRTTVLTCQNVFMEALWVRVGNDMNSIAALKPSTANPLLVQALSDNAVATYKEIADIISPHNANLKSAFDNWWTSYITFYQTPNATTNNAYINATFFLATSLQIAYSIILPISEIPIFNASINFYLLTLTADSTDAVLFFTNPTSYLDGVKYSSIVLKDTAFIGVFLDKSLSGDVPA